MTTLKNDMDNFKLEVDRKINTVDKKIDTVHSTMSQGFADIKTFMDDLLGNRSATRNVRARMDVDEAP